MGKYPHDVLPLSHGSGATHLRRLHGARQQDDQSWLGAVIAAIIEGIASFIW